MSDQADDKKSDVVEKAAKTKDKVVESAQAVTRSGKEKVVGSMTAAKDAVTSKAKEVLPDAEALKEKARGAASSTLAKLPDAAGLKRGAGKAGAAIANNPAVLALGSLAAGVLAGLAAPLTKSEREKVGPFASQARAKAMATGTRAAAERVSQKVDSGVDAVTSRVTDKVTEGIDTLAGALKGTAEKVGFGGVVQDVGKLAKEGVTSIAEDLAGRAKDKASEVVEKGKEKAAEKEREYQERPAPAGAQATPPAAEPPAPEAGPRPAPEPPSASESPSDARRYLR